MKPVIVRIDSSNSDRTMVQLIIEGIVHENRAPQGAMRAQAILPIIVELLADNAISLSDVTAIEVFPGPGSYTGLRVGFAVGNMLSTLLNIPINGGAPPKLPTYTTSSDSFS